MKKYLYILFLVATILGQKHLAAQSEYVRYLGGPGGGCFSLTQNNQQPSMLYQYHFRGGAGSGFYARLVASPFPISFFEPLASMRYVGGQGGDFSATSNADYQLYTYALPRNTGGVGGGACYLAYNGSVALSNYIVQTSKRFYGGAGGGLYGSSAEGQTPATLFASRNKGGEGSGFTQNMVYNNITSQYIPLAYMRYTGGSGGGYGVIPSTSQLLYTLWTARYGGGDAGGFHYYSVFNEPLAPFGLQSADRFKGGFGGGANNLLLASQQPATQFENRFTGGEGSSFVMTEATGVYISEYCQLIVMRFRGGAGSCFTQLSASNQVYEQVYSPRASGGVASGYTNSAANTLNLSLEAQNALRRYFGGTGGGNSSQTAEAQQAASLFAGRYPGGLGSGFVEGMGSNLRVSEFIVLATVRFVGGAGSGTAQVSGDEPVALYTFATPRNFGGAGSGFSELTTNDIMLSLLGNEMALRFIGGNGSGQTLALSESLTPNTLFASAYKGGVGSGFTQFTVNDLTITNYVINSAIRYLGGQGSSQGWIAYNDQQLYDMTNRYDGGAGSGFHFVMNDELPLSIIAEAMARRYYGGQGSGQHNDLTGAVASTTLVADRYLGGLGSGFVLNDLSDSPISAFIQLASGRYTGGQGSSIHTAQSVNTELYAAYRSRNNGGIGSGFVSLFTPNIHFSNNNQLATIRFFGGSGGGYSLLTEQEVNAVTLFLDRPRGGAGSGFVTGNSPDTYLSGYSILTAMRFFGGAGSSQYLLASADNEYCPIARPRYYGGIASGFDQLTGLNINLSVAPGLISSRYKGGQGSGFDYFNHDLLGIKNLYQWTGAVDQQWEVAGNWTPPSGSSEAVPNGAAFSALISDQTNQPTLSTGAELYDLTVASQADMTIAPQGYLTVNHTLTNEAGTTGLVLQSDATGTGSLIESSGNVAATAYRYISGTDMAWHLLSSPVVAQPLEGDLVSGGLYAWHEPTQGYSAFGNTTTTPTWDEVNGTSGTFVPARGYFAQYTFSANPTYCFTGLLNQGAAVFTLEKEGETAGSFGGFNLVGNPYPSAVDWRAPSGWSRSDLAMADTNTGYNMWVWNETAGNYGAHNSASTIDYTHNGVSRYIPSMQGFWVKAAVDDGTLGFTNATRAHSQQAWLKDSNSDATQLLKLSLTTSANTFSDEAIVQFGFQNDAAGAEKIYSMYNQAPQLFTSKAKGAYSINFLTNTEDHPSLPVGFIAGVPSFYSITALGTENFEYVILEDKALNTFTDLKAYATYSFDAAPAQDTSRFVVHFTKVTGTEQTAEPQPAIWYFAGYINLEIPWNDNTLVTVTDQSGRGVLNFNCKGEGKHVQRFIAAPGTYVVRMVNESNQSCVKIISVIKQLQ